MSTAPAFAREGDEITHANAAEGAHTGAIVGMAGGAIVGALVGAAILAPFTGGLSLAVVGAAVLAVGTGLVIVAAFGAIGAHVGAHNGSSGPEGSSKGRISSGSLNVFVNGRGAATACESLVVCQDHPGMIRVAQGSRSVFVNGHAAARIGDRGTCGFFIRKADDNGSPNVFVGGDPNACHGLPVGDGTPQWIEDYLTAWGEVGGAMALTGLAIMTGGGALTVGELAVALLSSQALTLVGGLGGSQLGSYLTNGDPFWTKTGGEIGSAVFPLVAPWLASKFGRPPAPPGGLRQHTPESIAQAEAEFAAMQDRWHNGEDIWSRMFGWGQKPALADGPESFFGGKPGSQEGWANQYMVKPDPPEAMQMSVEDNSTSGGGANSVPDKLKIIQNLVSRGMKAEDVSKYSNTKYGLEVIDTLTDPTKWPNSMSIERAQEIVEFAQNAGASDLVNTIVKGDVRNPGAIYDTLKGLQPLSQTTEEGAININYNSNIGKYKERQIAAERIAAGHDVEFGTPKDGNKLPDLVDHTAREGIQSKVFTAKTEQNLDKSMEEAANQLMGNKGEHVPPGYSRVLDITISVNHSPIDYGKNNPLLTADRLTVSRYLKKCFGGLKTSNGEPQVQIVYFTNARGVKMKFEGPNYEP